MGFSVELVELSIQKGIPAMTLGLGSLSGDEFLRSDVRSSNAASFK